LTGRDGAVGGGEPLEMIGHVPGDAGALGPVADGLDALEGALFFGSDQHDQREACSQISVQLPLEIHRRHRSIMMSKAPTSITCGAAWPTRMSDRRLQRISATMNSNAWRSMSDRLLLRASGFNPEAPRVSCTHFRSSRVVLPTGSSLKRASSEVQRRT